MLAIVPHDLWKISILAAMSPAGILFMLRSWAITLGVKRLLFKNRLLLRSKLPGMTALIVLPTSTETTNWVDVMLLGRVERIC